MPLVTRSLLGVCERSRHPSRTSCRASTPQVARELGHQHGTPHTVRNALQPSHNRWSPLTLMLCPLMNGVLLLKVLRVPHTLMLPFAACVVPTTVPGDVAPHDG